MKKIFALILATTMVLSLAACGGDTSEQSGAPAEQSTSAEQSTPGKIQPSADGTLNINLADAAVVVNGTSVPMPYRFTELVNAGISVDDFYNDIELNAGELRSLNLYLDENEDYLLMPYYSNNTDGTVNIADAEAGQIAMVTYASEPTDQNVSIFGIPFGMTKAEVLEMLGTPDADDGDHLHWLIEVKEDNLYDGSLDIWFTSDASDAGASQVDLSIIYDELQMIDD
ncbi:MAG: acid shock protein [Anaerotignum sp.]|nr:acid shock protein [Anaerotignum sp.]